MWHPYAECSLPRNHTARVPEAGSCRLVTPHSLGGHTQGNTRTLADSGNLGAELCRSEVSGVNEERSPSQWVGVGLERKVF